MHSLHSDFSSPEMLPAIENAKRSRQTSPFIFHSPNLNIYVPKSHTSHNSTSSLSSQCARAKMTKPQLKPHSLSSKVSP